MISACSGRTATPDAGNGAPGASDQVVLEFGHVKPIEAVWRAGDRILTRDSEYHWVLWDVASRHAVASGDQQYNYLALAGGMMMAHEPSSGDIQLRSVATGAVAGTIRGTGEFLPRTGLAVDGSYAWLATRGGIQAWSPTGTLLFDVAGDFSRAEVYAAPGELRVNADPANIQLVETIQVPSGSVATFPFAGKFVRWFDSGERFLTAVGTTAWVYARDGQRVAFADLPTTATLTGQGDHVWTFDGAQLRIYLATDLSVPIVGYALVNETPVPAGDTIALVGDDLEFITLGGAGTRSAPIEIGCTAFGGDPHGAWAIGTVHGLVYDSASAIGPPADRTSLSTGELLSLAGAPDGTAALSTASGIQILHVDAGGVEVRRTLPLAASRLELMADGSVMVIADPEDDTIRVVNVADGSVRHAFAGAGSLFELSPRGDVLARIDDNRITYTDLDGGAVASPGPAEDNILFAPDGVHVASTHQGLDQTTATTQLFVNGALAGAVDGVALAWLDDHRILTAKLILVHSISVVSNTIYDASGASLATLPPFTGARVSPLGDHLVYVPAPANELVDVGTGQAIWRGAAAAQLGTAVGTHDVIYTRGPHLYRASAR